MKIKFDTNASESLHAAVLEEVGQQERGALLFLQTKKRGVQRGRAGAKVTYGDDLVQVLLWTGFSYAAIIERSLGKLNALIDSGNLLTKLQASCAEDGHAVKIADCAAALQETREWFDRVLHQGSGPMPPAGPWVPLEVNGVRVPLCRVYQGEARPQNVRAPIPGHIYVQGMKIGERVVTPAAAGPWHTKKGSKTIAKETLRSWLPIGLYSQYSLDPQLTGHLVAGEGAVKRAKASGIQVDTAAFRKLFS